MRDGDADLIIGHFNKGASTRKLRKVHVLKPTGNPQKPFQERRYVNATQDEIYNVLARLKIVGLLPRSNLPDNLATVDLMDPDIPPLGTLDLEDGAEYVAVYGGHHATIGWYEEDDLNDEQLATSEGWPQSGTSGLEDSAAERAVDHLRELGHPNAERFCGAKLRFPTDPERWSLGTELEVIPELVAKDVEAVLPFKGKQLLGALCGMRTTRNMTDYNIMMRICELKGYQIFLPNSNDLSPGDGCVVSPGGPSCALSATSCSARSVTAKSVRRQRLAAAKHLPCHTRVLGNGSVPKGASTWP
ncbi:g8499 [Coccomyxa elongata]